jgi:hypothetical protein
MRPFVNALFPGVLDARVVQFELVLVLAALAMGLGRFRMKAVERLLQRCSKRPATAFVSCALLALALHLAVAPFMTRHAPEVHDEFSFLLSADTFLHGSAANPTHPLWRSFETAHVLFWPHYVSQYPPAQGLLLAGGKFLFGDYLAGPWLATAMLAGLAGWMLAGWVPGRWAVFGSFLVALRFGVFSYWGNSYWGGAVPAIGGMLLFGGLPRVLRKPRSRDAALVAIGLVLLAASRPFEGVLISVGALLASPAIRGKCFQGWKNSAPALATASVILAAGGASLLYFNWCVTGNPLVMGYHLTMHRYGLAVFPWQSTIAADPPMNANQALFYEALHKWLRVYLTPIGFISTRLSAFGTFWAYYLGPLFTLPFLAIPALGYSKRWRWIVIAGVFYALGLALNPWFLPHYAAPAMGLLLLALIQAARIVCAASAGRRRPFAFLVRAMPVICAAVFLFRAAAPLLGIPLPNTMFETSWYYTPAGNQDRAAVQDRLEHEPGRHLVLVRYEPGHPSHIEWVYNAARIDEAKVIWAHDLDAATNARLLAYYAGRRVWRLDPDINPRQPVEQARPPHGMGAP